MTRASALRALLAKVEAGEVRADGKKAKWNDFYFEGKEYAYRVNSNMAHAYNGSLDAAKALHEAVLPGWDWGRSAASGQFYVWNAEEEPASAMSNNKDPARAWLIAILKALIAQEGER